MKSLLGAIAGSLIALSVTGGAANASVVISGTRVVFPAAGGEVTVRLNNNGDQPVLVEAWIDDGDAQSTPDTAHVPFLTTPPLFRMNPGKGQSLRIVYTGQPLPKDRESLFWLNVLEIPPKPTSPTGEAQNTLQFAVRSRLKLFFRPAELTGNPLTAAQQLTWSSSTEGTGYALVVHNPTPYYITFSQLALRIGNTTYTPDTGMVAPLSSLRLPIDRLGHAPATGTIVDFTTINDFGAASSYKGTITP
ncbi:MAG TPA: fimbria/pilus periplasmic chaperone [Rhodanobacter sp.]